MLMIIPLEILMKIKNVAKVLQSQSFMANNVSNTNSTNAVAANPKSKLKA